MYLFPRDTKTTSEGSPIPWLAIASIQPIHGTHPPEWALDATDADWNGMHIALLVSLENWRQHRQGWAVEPLEYLHPSEMARLQTAAAPKPPPAHLMDLPSLDTHRPVTRLPGEHNFHSFCQLIRSHNTICVQKDETILNMFPR